MAEANSNSDELVTGGPVQVTGEEDHTPTDGATEQSEGTEQPKADSQAEDSTEGAKPKDEQPKPEAEDEEESFADGTFKPEELPDELKPVYKRMQAAFIKKTQNLARLQKDAETAFEGRQKPQDASQTGTADATADDVAAAVATKVGIDLKALDPKARGLFDLILGVAREVSGQTVQKAVSPIYERTTKEEIRQFFDANPDARQYTKQMAELERRSGGTLSMDELYVLASREDREKKVAIDRTNNAVRRSQQNAESSSGSTASGTPPANDPFGQMLEASKKRSELLG